MSAKSKQSELSDLEKKLNNDGVDPKASDDEKLLHLWRVYVQVETELATSLEEKETSKLQNAEEMKEVENYVEHIRTLSDEREALTIEFEHENEHLKQQVIELHEQLQSCKDEEISSLLSQQGLDDIAEGTVAEQVAYLLVERARLLDDVEAESARAVIETPDGEMDAQQLLTLLEQERRDFEDELTEQRDSTRAVKEQMKSMHEEEVNSLVMENQQLQELLDQANEKINTLDSVISKMQENLNDRMEQAVASLRASANPTPEVTDDPKVIDGTEVNEGPSEVKVKELEVRVQTMEDDNRTLIDNLKALGQELESEKSQHSHTISLKERTTRRLQIEIDQQKQTIEELENTEKTLTEEKHRLEKKVEELQAEIQDMKSNQTTSVLQQTKAEEEEEEETHARLRNSLRSAQSEKSEVEDQLEETLQTLKQEREKVEMLGQQASASEEEARSQRRHFDKKETDFRAKLKALESQVQTLEDEISNRDRQHQLSERDLKKVVSNLRMELEIEQGKVRQEQKRRQHMEQNFSEARMANTNSLMELENSNTQLETMVHDLQTTVQVITHERDKLAKALETQEMATTKVSVEKRELKEKVDWLEKTSSLLAEENTQLHQEVQASVEHRESAELELALEELREENTVVHSQLRDRDQQIAQLKLQLEDQNLVNIHLKELEQEETTIQAEATTTTQHQPIQEDSQLNTPHIQQQIKDLTEQLFKKEEKIETLKSKLNNEISSLSNQLSELENINTELNKEISTLSDKLSEKEHELEMIKTQLNEDISLLTEQLTEKETEIEGVKKELTEKLEEVVGLKQQLCDIKGDENDADSLIQAQEAEVKGLRVELGDTRGQYLELERENQAFREQTDSQRVRCETLEEKCEQLEDKVEDLESQCAEIEALKSHISEYNHLKEASEKQHSHIQALKQQLSEAQASLSARTSEHDHKVSLMSRNNQNEVLKLTVKVERLSQDNSTLSQELSEKSQDLSSLRSELSRKETENTLTGDVRQSQLQQETTVLRQKLAKRETDVGELRSSVSQLETGKSRLQGELSRKSRDYNDLETRLSSHKMDQNSMLIQAQTRAEEADRRATRIQEDLTRAMSRVEASEEKVHEVATLRHDLQVKDREISGLRDKLHEEKLNKTVASHSTEEFRSQLNQFRDRERELQRQNADIQHTLVDLEGKLNSTNEKIRTQTELREVAESAKHTLSLQLCELEREVDRLKGDVRTATDMYDQQVTRYNDRKLRTKHKLQQAREMYHAEKQKIRVELDHIRNENSLNLARLEGEQKWRETMENTNSKVTAENRLMLAQVSELESMQRDHSRGLSMAGVKVKYLEEENHSLQQRVDTLTLQKHNLERVVKEYQSERIREEHQHQLTLRRSSSAVTRPSQSRLDNHDALLSQGPPPDNAQPPDSLIIAGGGEGMDKDDTMVSSTLSEAGHSDMSHDA